MEEQNKQYRNNIYSENMDVTIIEKKIQKQHNSSVAKKESVSSRTSIEKAAYNEMIYPNCDEMKTDSSKFLGKNRQSAIKKNRENKRITKYVAPPVVNGVQEKIKQIAKENKIRELMNADNPSDMVKIIGEKGARGVVNIFFVIVNQVRKIYTHILITILTILGPYILIAALSLICMFVPFIVINSLDLNISWAKSSVLLDDNYSDNENYGSVKVPRIEGTKTALTYAQVLTSSYYSHYHPNGTPFFGDNGLDKQRGDRGGNCTAYAWGRRCELEGKRTDLGAAGDACAWYAREQAAGIYECGQKAKVGAVVCWSYGSGVNGHVAIIEKINKDGSIVTSNSAYGSMTGIPILFYNSTYKNEQELKNAYAIFQGYIYLDRVKKETSYEKSIID